MHYACIVTLTLEVLFPAANFTILIPPPLTAAADHFVAALNHRMAAITTPTMGLNLDSMVAAVVLSTIVPSFLRVAVRHAVILVAGLRRHLAPPSLAAIGTEETRWLQSMLMLSVENRISSTLGSVAAAARLFRRGCDYSKRGCVFQP
ncbi:unnamed protein product [Lactuca virosa]|uniref:Uncharacterized protein n=1 Tax=Lactuca virosa TaxID=75947 RepID=A0AAU9LFK8_9ASTR|nr:unnamed protein product [Lactuca virosa]